MIFQCFLIHCKLSLIIAVYYFYIGYKYYYFAKLSNRYTCMKTVVPAVSHTYLTRGIYPILWCIRVRWIMLQIGFIYRLYILVLWIKKRVLYYDSFDFKLKWKVKPTVIMNVINKWSVTHRYLNILHSNYNHFIWNHGYN